MSPASLGPPADSHVNWTVVGDLQAISCGMGLDSLVIELDLHRRRLPNGVNAHEWCSGECHGLSRIGVDIPIQDDLPDVALEYWSQGLGIVRLYRRFLRRHACPGIIP